MTEATAAASALPTGAPLSEVERLVDVFVAPQKTFTDILRNSSWWAPFILISIVSLVFVFVVQKQVGWEKVVDNSLKANPAQAEQVANSPAARPIMIASYKYSAWASPVFIILVALIGPAILLATLNFGFGGTAKFGKLLAVWMYAGLPGLIKALLGIIVLFAGMNADSFQLQNPVGTNLGYYFPDSPHWLVTLLTSIDIINIWTAILLIIGCATVAKVKRGTAAMAVVGWWVLFLLITVGYAAAKG